VTGLLTAGGTLKVSLDPAAPAPLAGDAFNILDFASAAGGFDRLMLPALEAGLMWDASRLYTEGILAVGPGVAGDYNGNGVVDAADYTVWRNNVGAPAGTLRNDADLTVIGRAQSNTWKAHYGMSLMSAGAAKGVAVPEPTGLALLALACLVCFKRRHP
jgi:hypothetical protein